MNLLCVMAEDINNLLPESFSNFMHVCNDNGWYPPIFNNAVILHFSFLHFSQGSHPAWLTVLCMLRNGSLAQGLLQKYCCCRDCSYLPVNSACCVIQCTIILYWCCRLNGAYHATLKTNPTNPGCVVIKVEWSVTSAVMACNFTGWDCEGEEIEDKCFTGSHLLLLHCISVINGAILCAPEQVDLGQRVMLNVRKKAAHCL